jgi:hypothetical protein
MLTNPSPPPHAWLYSKPAESLHALLFV